MPTLTINGRKVRVDEKFLSLTPEQQNATVDEIAQSFAKPDRSAEDIEARENLTALGHTPEQSAGQEGEPKQFGLGDTWPARLGKALYGAVTLPGDVAAGRVTPNDAEYYDRATDLAAVASPVNPAIRAGGRMIPGAGDLGPKAPNVPVTSRADLVEASERIGVPMPRAAVSDTMGVQQVGKIATNIPLGGTPLRKASEKAIGKLDEAATKTQQGFGSGDVASAGAAAREGLTDFIKAKSSARVTEQYKKVDELVDQDVKTPLVSTKAIADRILSRRERAAITEQSDAVRRIDEAIKREGMDYQGLKDLRSYIGELVDTGVLPVDLSRAELKQIYSSLTDDLRSVIRKAGGERGVRAWERANTYARVTSARRENLARILGANSDEAIFSRLVAAAGSTSRADIKLLTQARRSVDNDAWDEIASGVISALGRSPGAGGAPERLASGQFSPDRFVTSWNKITPQAKSLLFRSTGKSDLADALDDIAKVSLRFKSLQQFANPSGTGQTVAGVGMLGGVWVDPVTAGTTIMSARVISAVLARPVTAKSMARWAKAYEVMVKNPARGALEAFNRATRAFAEDVGRTMNAPQHVGELMRQLQGVVPVRPDDQEQ